MMTSGRREWILAVLIAAVTAIDGPASTAATTLEEAVQAFDVQVPFAPISADSGGTRQLVYELHLTNFAGRPIMIDRISVIEPASGRVIGSAEGQALGAWIGHIGTGERIDVRVVPSGGRAIVYLDLPLADADGPTQVRHHIEFHFPDDAEEGRREIVGAATNVRREALPELGPPLRGGPWVAVYDPAMERGHRRVLYAVDGSAQIPGRFAIDWFGIDGQGRSSRDGSRRVDQVHGYGAEVLAVADGVIAAVRDDMSEPQMLDEAARVPIGDSSGNHVVLALGDGRFAFYEHLRPGIRVRPGQAVRRGDVLGFLGFTGQTTGPHLHFHLADAPSPLDAEGLPYLIEGFDTLGSYRSIEAFVRSGAWDPPGRPAPSQATFPGANWVVRFPGRPLRR